MEVVEGSTRLTVPATTHVKGPKKKEGGAFYNPAMRAARDVSVLVLSHLVESTKKTWRVIDAMAATGARGIRLANEVPNVKVQLNDVNDAAMQMAERNARGLHLRNVDFRIGRLESHLAAEPYDWVDIDPFGTPAPFLDVAMLSVTDGGILAVTATDRATLSGVYPEACLRRYNAKPLKGVCMPEVGLRILLGAVARAAGRRDRAATPILSYSEGHYCRAYVRIHGGPKEGDDMTKRLGVAWAAKDLTRGLAAEAPPGARWGGPLWTGPLVDPELAASAAAASLTRPGISKAAQQLLARLSEEATAPGLYHMVEELTRGTTTEAPRMEDWIERVRAGGHRAVRTHFTPRAIKSDAPLEALRSALASAPRAGTRSR